jgi:hypothetical protein
MDEFGVQCIVASALRRAGVMFCAIPNERSNKRQAIRLSQSGVLKGAPDLLIFDAPAGSPGCIGTAMELKRDGAPPSSVRPEQRAVLAQLAKRNWLALEGLGLKDALAKLRAAGYDL